MILEKYSLLDFSHQLYQEIIYMSTYSLNSRNEIGKKNLKIHFFHIPNFFKKVMKLSELFPSMKQMELKL